MPVKKNLMHCQRCRVGIVYWVLLGLIVIACTNLQSTDPSWSFSVFGCVFQLLELLPVSSMGPLVTVWANPLRQPTAHYLLLPLVRYHMWLWCLQLAGEPPSGKHRPILYAAYEGYKQKWREICWAGKSESVSCDKSNYLLLLWQNFLVCLACKCWCVLNHQKYPCPEEFTGCAGIKLSCLFTGRELSWNEWVVQNSTGKSLSKLETGPAMWHYGLRHPAYMDVFIQ